MNKFVLTIIVFSLTLASAFAQGKSPSSAEAMQAPDSAEKLRLAISSATYPVTPGDDYRLTFQQGGAASMLEILVGSDYVVQLNVFGKVNAEGMTFTQVKQIVEKAFAAAYPRSLPSLAISSVGAFEVFIKGETPEASNVDAWGMSRLSEVLAGKLGPYSCLRNVRVISRDGADKQYDLFQFQRLGLEDQDPSMKPGDTVVLSPAERIVEVAGEVRRPGKYQLLPIEQLKEAIDFFGGGLTAAAETSRIRIDRISGEKAQTLYVDMSHEGGSQVELKDGDVVTIPSKTTALPVVYFEGAVIAETTQTTPAAPAPESQGMFPPMVYNRIPYSFRQGETLKSALVLLKNQISPNANLAGSFLVREGLSKPIPVDLSALLAGNLSTDIPLWPLDRIIIPASQFSVAVYGDVARPGNYPYTPSESYRHYADLAGFADMEEIQRNIVILDTHGQRHPTEDFIEPGSRIYLTAARVTVQGAVLNPGNFAYRGDFSVSDYENQAGGFDPEKSTNTKVLVFDSKGNSRKHGEALQPGDRIYVSADRFSYNFNRDLPIILSVITTVSTAITVYALLR
jgi:protein involved in polysaccharide export with SLBB domain